MLELPVELVTAVSLAVTAWLTKLIVDGVKALSESLGWDLSRVGTIIAAAVSAAVVSILIGLANFGLSFVPPEWWPVAQSIFLTLVGMFGAMGVHRAEKKKRLALSASG